MPKGIPNKRYTPEFKQQVVEAVMQDGLSYKEAARLYDVQGHDRIRCTSRNSNLWNTSSWNCWIIWNTTTTAASKQS